MTTIQSHHLVGGQEDPNHSTANQGTTKAGQMTANQPKKQSLLGGTIAEKFGGSSKDILEEE